jgi:hypothetical protein
MAAWWTTSSQSEGKNISLKRKLQVVRSKKVKISWQHESKNYATSIRIMLIHCHSSELTLEAESNSKKLTAKFTKNLCK